MSLVTGQPAPAFSLPGDDGQTHDLQALAGRIVILYFYPKDNTPGCTKQAIAFSELRPQFEQAGATIIGVSRGTVASKGRFRDKHGLTITLCADPEAEIIQKYGVWVEKKLYGRAYMGIDRATFLIDAQGILRRQWHKVKVPGHAQEVLDAVRALAAGQDPEATA